MRGLTIAFLIAFLSTAIVAAVDHLWPLPLEPDWGMELEYCESGKPDGHAWIDSAPGSVLSLTVEVDHNADGKSEEFWRTEGAGKVALYWPGLPGFRYRVSAIVDGEGYGPTHWFYCTE